MWNFIDIRGAVSFKNGGFDKNIVIFGAGVSSPVHVDNKKRKRYLNSWCRSNTSS